MKKAIDGFSRKAREARTILATVSLDIAFPRSLLSSMGSKSVKYSSFESGTNTANEPRADSKVV